MPRLMAAPDDEVVGFEEKPNAGDHTAGSGRGGAAQCWSRLMSPLFTSMVITMSGSVRGTSTV